MNSGRSPSGPDFITVIAGRKQKDRILDALVEEGCHLINAVYAKGSLTSGWFMDMLGLVPEEKKIFITCLAEKSKTESVFRILKERFDFDRPNTGIAFAVPVDKLSV